MRSYLYSIVLSCVVILCSSNRVYAYNEIQLSNISSVSKETTQTVSTQPRFVFVGEKSPFVGLALGSLVGFGVGNYYVDDVSLGIVGSVVESIGWGLIIAGWIYADDDNDGALERSEIKNSQLDSTEKFLLIGGLSTIVANRVFGAVTGYIGANQFNKELSNKFRYESSIFPVIDPKTNSYGAGLKVTF